MKNLKKTFAIVGCGNIGKRHVAVVDAQEKAELVAICDADEAVCKEISLLYDGVPYYVSYEQMLEEVKADVICICTPHALHAPMTVDACNKGFNVLVEKPMALTQEDCDTMIAAAKKNGVQLHVVKQNRFNIPIQLTKDALNKGMLGEIFMVKCDVLWNRYQGYYDDSPWRGSIAQEGGALHTQVSHFIDLLIWWFGDVVEAHAITDMKNHKIEIEDCGSAVLKFDKGTIGSLNWTTCVYNTNYEGSITIIAENGTIKIGGKYLNKIEYWDVAGFPLPEGIEFSDKPNSYGKYQGTSSNHAHVIQSYISVLSNEAAEFVEGEEAKKTIRAIDMIYGRI